MAFLSRFFAAKERQPLPTPEEILSPRGIAPDLPGLEAHLEDFPHLNAEERNLWGDAVQDLVTHGWPLPPLCASGRSFVPTRRLSPSPSH